ncbi:unnamed protein product, partial [marine sediment metagenome]
CIATENVLIETYIIEYKMADSLSLKIVNKNKIVKGTIKHKLMVEIILLLKLKLRKKI